MEDPSRGSAEIAPPMRAALDILQSTQQYYQWLPSDWTHVAQHTAQTLLEWRLPSTVVVAALLSPLLSYNVPGAAAKFAQFEPEVLHLAGRLVAWHSARRGVGSSDGLPSLPHEKSLPALFRDAYMDLPGLRYILLLMADHHARVCLVPAAPTGVQLAETKALFIPLAEMLGLWELRRRWLERVTAVEAAAGYHSVRKALTDSLTTRARACASLRAGFLARVHETGLLPVPRIWATDTLLTSDLRPALQGQGGEEQSNRLVLRVLCASAQDCYAALGIIHSLGKPVAPRYAARFDDFIASPHANGYQALHTAIMFNYRDERDESKYILCEIRILTPAMHRLNEWGAVAALYRCPKRYTGIAAWWNDLERLTRELRSRYTRLERRLEAHARLRAQHAYLLPYPSTLQEFLARFDVGTASTPLYVFTPRGQLFLLDEASTALDFAYHIHTDVGNFARRMEVNGTSASHNRQLRNGDWVQIHDHPTAAGPDLPWLGWAVTTHAKSKIRRQLTQRARALHKGRALIEDAVLKGIQFYRHQRDYELDLDRRRLDSFLARTAKALQLTDPHELYEQVVAKPAGLTWLVRRLISEELAILLLNAAGEPLTYPLDRVLFCDTCCPVPGMPLRAYMRKTGSTATWLVVHSTSCRREMGSGQPIRLRWAEPHTTRTLADIVVLAEDRSHLLGDILDSIYDEAIVYTHKVVAETHGDGKADIRLTVRVESFEQLSALQAHIERIPDVRQVFCYPAPTGQALALEVPSVGQVRNPYTPDEVYSRDTFYDREPLISDLLTWLADPAQAQLMVLHGQRRVGKTSLLRYLMHEILPGKHLTIPIVPVLLDLQNMSGHIRMAQLASYISLAIRGALPSLAPLPPAPGADEEPTLWLSRYLKELVGCLPGRQLLLMIDEVDVLLDLDFEDAIDERIFDNLRAVITECREIGWLLVVSDVYYRDPESWRAAGRLFQQGTPLVVTNLDVQWAYKLILEPIRNCGMQFASADPAACMHCMTEHMEPSSCATCIPQQIFELTAGNPYFIQILCHELVDGARRQKRMRIEAEDLDSVVRLALNDGKRYFDHFLRNLTDSRRQAVLAALASRCEPRAWADLAGLRAFLVTDARVFSNEILDISLKHLERLGVIEMQADQVRILHGLFHRWIKIFWPLTTVLGLPTYD